MISNCFFYQFLLGLLLACYQLNKYSSRVFILGKRANKGISARELLKFIPEDKFASIIEDTKVNYQVKKLYGRSMFYLLLYGLLESTNASLRGFEQLFNSPKFKITFKIDWETNIKYNSLSDRLATINADFFKQMYELMYQEFSKYFNKEDGLSYNIVSVDSTMVAEAANKLKEGMVVKNQTKKASKHVKYTVSLTNLLPSSAEAFTKQNCLNENITIPKLIKDYVDNSKDNVFVFDRGVKSRKVFDELDEKDILFVTRISDGGKYDLVRSSDVESGLTIGNLIIQKDEIVILYNKYKQKSSEYRLIQTIDNKNKPLWFLTNLFDESVENIISIYKKRWEIEVFFKFIKQQLSFKHFISTNENGIKVILYMTMIMAMLILMYKKANGLGYTDAKRRLYYEIEDFYAAILIENSGGDPNLVFR